MSPALIAVIVIVGAVLLVALGIIIWYVSTSNKLKRMAVKVDESASGIDVALTKRFDLLTKSVQTVKGYAKHESETLTKVIEMRQPASNATMKEKSEFNNAVDTAFRSLNVVVEQYPDLKASSNFLALQNQITDVEEQLQAARRVYNSNASIFNQTIIVFPSSIVANRLRLEKRDFFEAEEHKRQDVEISF